MSSHLCFALFLSLIPFLRILLYLLAHSLPFFVSLLIVFHLQIYLFTLLLCQFISYQLTLPHCLVFPSSTLMPCFLQMLYFSSHPVSIHPDDPVSLQAELLLLDGTLAQWRRTLLSLPALSIYGVSPFVVSHLPIAQ